MENAKRMTPFSALSGEGFFVGAGDKMGGRENETPPRIVGWAGAEWFAGETGV